MKPASEIEILGALVAKMSLELTALQARVESLEERFRYGGRLSDELVTVAEGYRPK